MKPRAEQDDINLTRAMDAAAIADPQKLQHMQSSPLP
jgi:hypothetical protein